MTLTLHNLQSTKHQRRAKRVGRGNASGKGNYATRGLKGQKSRSGGRKGLKARALKDQLISKTPKLRGFQSMYKKMEITSVGDLEKKFKDGEIITPRRLFLIGLISKTKLGVKILGQGKLTKKLTVKANAFSKSAKEAITQAGGEAIVI